MEDVITIATNGYGEGVVLDPDMNWLYLVTPCCGASGKGSLESESGVVCRSCYETVDPAFGTGVSLSEGADAVRFWLLNTAFEFDADRISHTEQVESELAALARS